MPRKRINKEPLTNAEKQRRYRTKQKANIEAFKTAAVPDISSLRENIKKELRETWEPELKKYQIAEQRKEGRRLARLADQSHDQGRIEGICDAAAFFIGRDRSDITEALLKYFMIDRETAANALQSDKRTKSMTFSSLDKARRWFTPYPVK